MESPLKGKAAVVTGASRGIGREIALTLGRLGAAVAVNYVKSAQQAASVAAEISAGGVPAIAVKADIRMVAETKQLMDSALETFGSLDILINNAGLAIFKEVEKVAEEDFDNIFATNVKGLYFACQLAARRMSPGGRIINISSSATKLMSPGYSLYSATKGAVNQITRILAKELGPRNITVNTVSPGPTDTELFREGKSKAQIESLAQMAALGRLGTPVDIANAVALLVGETAGWITGQNIYVNGGFVS